MQPRPATIVFSTVFLTISLARADAQERAPKPITTKPMEFAEAFSTIVRPLELANGTVLLHDAREKRLGVADLATGTFRVVAREGAGPLEYRSVVNLLRVPGDSVLLFDISNARVLYLSPTGAPVRSSSISQSGDMMGMLRTMPRGIDARGRWYAAYQGFSMGAGKITEGDSLAIVRTPAGGGKQDTLMTIHSPRSGQTSGSGSRLQVRAAGFPSRNAWTLFPDGRVLFLHGETYQPEVVEPDGTRRKLPPIPFTRYAVTAQDKARHMKETIDRTKSMRMPTPNGGEIQFEAIEPQKWETHMPPLQSDVIRVDSKARGWVRVTDKDPDAGEVYDLLTSDGKRVDRYRMPRGTKLAAMGKNVLYATREDEDGLVYLQRYPLP